MISICMATQNGSRYIKAQLDSILPQLNPTDEVVISDDCSSDDTLEIIQSYKDCRIKIYKNDGRMGIVKNFESSLLQSQGDYIFLADQDDVWLPHKIEIMSTFLEKYDLVVCNCALVNDNLRSQPYSFFEINNSRKGLLRNIYKNSYMGCCMAFNKNLLTHCLPFPEKIPMHDLWIGLLGDLHFKVKFIDEVLVHHRLHVHNASATGRKSVNSFSSKISTRFITLKHIFTHTRQSIS